MRFGEGLTSLHQPTHLGHVLFGVMLCMTFHRGFLPSGQFFGTAVRHAKKKKAPPNGRAVCLIRDQMVVVSKELLTISSTMGIRSTS